MEVYYYNEKLEFKNIHLTLFENEFFRLAKELPNLIQPNFSSILELKDKNKDILELAFNTEFHQNY